jgi:acetyl-CoA carboxylase carboxyl transferase subunit alpha
MAKSWKEWEKPLLDLEEQIRTLRSKAAGERDERKRELALASADQFEKRLESQIEVRYSRLGPWEKALVARAEPRPYTLDYIQRILVDFTELDGDRRHGSDHAIIGGPAYFDGRPVMVVGHQKGRNLNERAFRNFGMAKPEGYRKAIRLFEMAERFRLPVLTFVDTPAADPGVESESRGISEAIAASMLAMFELTVPVVSVVIGEGGSGGAIGIAIANQVMMLEHAIYSVIPPEGCAAILWRDAALAAQAAAALRLTAQHAHEAGLIDAIIAEPFGGAHRDPAEAARLVHEALAAAFASLDGTEPADLKRLRAEKFAAMGAYA